MNEGKIKKKKKDNTDNQSSSNTVEDKVQKKQLEVKDTLYSVS